MSFEQNHCVPIHPNVQPGRISNILQNLTNGNALELERYSSSGIHSSSEKDIDSLLSGIQLPTRTGNIVNNLTELSLIKINLGHYNLRGPAHSHRSSPLQEGSVRGLVTPGDDPDDIPFLPVVESAEFSGIGKSHAFGHIMQGKGNSDFPVYPGINQDIPGLPGGTFTQKTNQVLPCRCRILQSKAIPGKSRTP